MKVCTRCGAELPDDAFPSNGGGRRRTTCRDCTNARAREWARKRGEVVADGYSAVNTDLITNPGLYAIGRIYQQALEDLRCFDRPLRRPRDRMADRGIDGAGPVCYITKVRPGTYIDAENALAWMREFGADFCELMDLPREWAAEAIDGAYDTNHERQGETVSLAADLRGAKCGASR